MKNPSPTCMAAFVCGLMLLSSGCYLPILNGPPGTIGMQRSRAVLNDPFPSNTLGPEITGGRPRGFDLPLAEATSYQSHPLARRKSRGLFAPVPGSQVPLLPPPPPQNYGGY